MRRRSRNFVIGTLSLMIGAAMYICYRPNTYAAKIGRLLAGCLGIAKISVLPENALLGYYLPDLLWSFSLNCWLQGVLLPLGKRWIVWGLAGPVCGTVWELLQLWGFVSGTADCLDVVMYLLGALLCALLNFKEIEYEKI